MWIYSRKFLFAFLSLLLFFSWDGLAEGVTLTEEEYLMTQEYIKILLKASDSSEEKYNQLIPLLNKSETQQTELMNQLNQVKQDLKQASKDSEILLQIAGKLNLSPEELEKILPALEKQAKDWQISLELAESDKKFWETTAKIGIPTALVLGMVGGFFLGNM